jgi:threonyl-tRNA synthetase
MADFGLTRVRRLHQDDAYIFSDPEQINAEIVSLFSV